MILTPEPFLRPMPTQVPGQTIGYSTYAYSALEYGE